MTLQDFKNDLEQALLSKVRFELLEFHYLGYKHGHGYIAYRIKGYVYVFVYDGREDRLILRKSNSHSVYPSETMEEVFAQNGLSVASILTILQ
jgi:hypothetical protein